MSNVVLVDPRRERRVASRGNRRQFLARETRANPVVLKSATPEPAVLPVIGPAPAWRNEVWINSEGPLPLEDLRGQVVLLEFWTFG